jgi:hypothetical protein
MWQTASSPAAWSPAAGPAGRRRAAPFTVGLARSFAQRASARRALAADRTVAASLLDWIGVVAQELAAPGGVADGEMFQGTDERASQCRCLKLGDEVSSNAGVGLASRPR